jgi:hypothetical protein
MMPKKLKLLPKVATKEIVNGRIHACDANGRPCFDLDNPERVVLTHDFRAYAPELHRGALGWTIPTDSDGYTFARIAFDAGPRLRLRNFAVDRVPVETAEAVAAQIIAENRNTRFDADRGVAARYYQEFLASYGNTLSLASTIFGGTGDQEIYAFTYPSLVEIATLKGETVYPVKIGYSKSGYGGAGERIRSLITEKAGFPEKPVVLLIFKTWDGRKIEAQVHRKLRAMGRKAESLGREWFRTSTAELRDFIAGCEHPTLPDDRILVGSDETIAEGFDRAMKNGAVIEMGLIPGQAAAMIRIRYPDQEPKEP